jgi:hypothetical protein
LKKVKVDRTIVVAIKYFVYYVSLIKDMYDNVVTSVRTSDRDTNDFSINIGLHQGSALSPYLFALVMDEVTYRSVEDS